MTKAESVSWRELNERLNNLNEGEVGAMLEAELNVGKRKSLLVRLHQRFTILRAQRERREMLLRIGHRPPMFPMRRRAE